MFIDIYLPTFSNNEFVKPILTAFWIKILKEEFKFNTMIVSGIFLSFVLNNFLLITST
jgi:hypothetical protein